jgi:hypothetical protein
MKIFFLVSSIGTCYLMLAKFKATYDRNHDSFRFDLSISAFVDPRSRRSRFNGIVSACGD